VPVPGAGFKDFPAPQTVLTDSDTLIGLVERGGGLPDLASRQALDQAIAKGRGGIFLDLTPEQYERLRQR
jgi:hypothetical protein